MRHDKHGNVSVSAIVQGPKDLQISSCSFLVEKKILKLRGPNAVIIMLQEARTKAMTEMTKVR
jgi:hypothetical protein